MAFSDLLAVRFGAIDGLASQAAPRDVSLVWRGIEETGPVLILCLDFLYEVLLSKEGDSFCLQGYSALL